MLTSAIDANFCHNYNNHCENSILEESFSLKIFILNGTKKTFSYIVHAKTLEHFLLPLVLNRKSEASE